MFIARFSRGFTLVEVLVALVIVGLLAGLISSTLRPDERTMLQAEAERLAQLLHLAGNEAQMSGKFIAWTTDGARYWFLQYRRVAGWAESRDDHLFRERRLPPGMKIEGMKIEGTLMVSTAEGSVMRMEFTPHGWPPVYTISISFNGEQYVVEGSPIGDVRAIHAGKTTREM